MTSEAQRALALRSQLAKSSTAKLDALAARVSPDGWLRRNYKYYGAHTGRWSGEGVQLQNLPRGVLDANQYLVACDRIRNGGAVDDLGVPLEVIASCLRGAFRAPEGKKFVVSDLAQIEVRVLAWLAGCQDLQLVFENDEDPYLNFAVRMYDTQYGLITKHQRQIAKSAVLGCGYQLSGGEEVWLCKQCKTFRSVIELMCRACDELFGIEVEQADVFKTGLWGYADGMGIEMSQEEAHEAVDAFRQAYPEVVALWRNLENAAIKALADRCDVEVGPVRWRGLQKVLCAFLPSGRRLHYLRPEVTQEGDWPKLSYEAVLVGKKWGRRNTYGGHLTENLVQAIARDVLAEGMLRADSVGMTLVGHTHDEIICLQDTVMPALDMLLRCMTSPMPWAPDLKLAADGYESEIYRK